MTYRPTDVEARFLLKEVLNFEQVQSTERFADADDEMVTAILSEAGKMCESELAPLNRNGDLHPAYLENGVVRTSPGFKDGFAAIAEGGWLSTCAGPDRGGMGLPLTLSVCVNEMMSSACLSLALNPLMSHGQIEALEKHASDELQKLYIPKLVKGEWTGTMNLTEPQAGSDVGALRSKAEKNADGTYSVTGQKIYISWGDHDLTDNIVHLVLARLPDGVPGPKGISLFLVPKVIPNEDGSLGKMNSLKPISLEHKLGLHGSPTAVMDYDHATGWLVGEEHDGMAAMFTMMNNARLGVGVQGLGIAEAATQKAISYALDRKQGRSPIEHGHGSIVDHADVRRMLMSMKVQTFVSRALCLDCAISADMSTAMEDAVWEARGAFLTPIAKAFGTDAGFDVASLGVQIHGGMGFIEETGAAQFMRDVRVTSIYEGTNGIQAMDLVGRKLSDGGATAKALLAEISETADKTDNNALRGAVIALSNATDWMVAADPNDRFAGATSYLRAFAFALGGHYLAKAAIADSKRAPMEAFFATTFLNQTAALCETACAGSEALYAIPAEALSA